MSKIFNLSRSSTVKSEQKYFGNNSLVELSAQVLGAQQWNNCIVAGILFLAGLGFFLTGFVVYLTQDNPINEINYLPQGIILTFYGILGITVSIFISLTIYWNIGFGWIKFSKLYNDVQIYREGYPQQKAQIFLNYQLNSIKSLEIKITEGINPTQVIYLCLKDDRQIPLIFTDSLPTITKTEQRATFLCNFLNVPLNIKTIKAL